MPEQVKSSTGSNNCRTMGTGVKCDPVSAEAPPRHCAPVSALTNRSVARAAPPGQLPAPPEREAAVPAEEAALLGPEAALLRKEGTGPWGCEAAPELLQSAAAQRQGAGLGAPRAMPGLQNAARSDRLPLARMGPAEPAQEVALPRRG